MSFNGFGRRRNLHNFSREGNRLVFDNSKNDQRRPPMRCRWHGVIDNVLKPRSGANQAVGSGGAEVEEALAMPTDLHGWQDLISALSTGVVALFTIALFWVGWRQIRDTKISNELISASSHWAL